MKFVIISAALAVVAFAAPQYGRGGGDSSEEIPILRDDRDRDDFGRYSVNVETANGIDWPMLEPPTDPRALCVLWILLLHITRGRSSRSEIRRQRERIPAPV
ncbi:uncharacterized protein LOC135206454 [Macrobrachium nipponense]|uniref:uncharacterized protein LOC135206454 n=1 Tax=Macrobrachium nipponense TaxID=159736 RepID=UPI0030C8B7D1